MEIAEHLYTDDPAVGHPDVRTRLPDTDYFFLGNGHIHVAVQLCRSGIGTPVGLAVMHPHAFGPKRAALTCDPEKGLEETLVRVRVGDSIFSPEPAELIAGWEAEALVPTVRVEWKAGPARVVERFFCPGLTQQTIARHIEVQMTEGEGEDLFLCVGPEDEEWALGPASGWVAAATLIHEVRPKEDGFAVISRWVEEMGPSPEAASYWHGLTHLHTTDPDLDSLFSAARSHLPTAVDHKGRMDGSIWQYNLEWVRDQAHVTEALVRLGDTAKARTMLARLLDHFVSPEGDTVDSGARRGDDDVELDQNGELLAALGTYVDWTGELDLVAERWETVRALASFPSLDRFRQKPSGLLHNRREYWERHAGHGIEDGFELMSQFFVVVGLEAAARLADLLGEVADARRWREAGAALKTALLEDPTYRLVEDGHLIKRRGVDGVWQETIHMESGEGLPDAIPLLQDGPHFLDPDASSALLVAYEFIDPGGELATNSLAHIEELWNQWWEGGGYGRYHASSEADLPGAWPFASLFVARAYAESGEDEKVLRVLRWMAATPGGASGAWFENDGPRIAPPYAQLGFTPWTWAELTTLFVHHLLGVRPDSEGVTLRPRLLEGLPGMEALLTVRGHRLHVSVRAAGSGEERGGRVDGEVVPWRKGGVRIPLPTSDIQIEIFC